MCIPKIFHAKFSICLLFVERGFVIFVIQLIWACAFNSCSFQLGFVCLSACLSLVAYLILVGHKYSPNKETRKSKRKRHKILINHHSADNADEGCGNFFLGPVQIGFLFPTVLCFQEMVDEGLLHGLSQGKEGCGL